MSALPKMFWPETDPDFQHLGDLKQATEEGSACIECGESWGTPAKKAPAICTTCANTLLGHLLDQLGYTLRRDRGLNAEAHARRARERRGE